MTLLDSYLHFLLLRAQLLVPLLVIAFFIGDELGRVSGMAWVLTRVGHAAAFFNRKLDRPNRSIATRVYRGIVAVFLLLLPALLVGLALTRPFTPLLWIGDFLIVALIGHHFQSLSLGRLWSRARTHALPLELPGTSYLFADSHGVLRHLIRHHGEAFAVGVVGASVWYVLVGLPALLVYLLLAQLAVEYRSPAFGWAARALFRLMDAAPRILTSLLLVLAALFVPGAHPFAARHARSYPALLAELLHLSLGGRAPTGDHPWVGRGTPLAMPAHLLVFLLLRLAATVMLLLLLASPFIAKLLTIIS